MIEPTWSDRDAGTLPWIMRRVQFEERRDWKFWCAMHRRDWPNAIGWASR
jgi:hypothetical protein